jgi:ribosomal protein S18 acetylase RimI-like enzyme
MIRVMTIDDYDGVYALWKKIKGFGIRSIDDSKEGVERFLRRNPTTSFVAVKEGKISLEEGKEFLSNYRSGLYGYTYLE